MTSSTESQTKITSTNGFPPGYFIIRSKSTGRLLDIAGDYAEDGTEVILWPEKESSLVESRRDPQANNQVFFIDTSGALCSRQSGHAIDIEEDRLVLRHRRPISLPFPNHYSHPLPTFHFIPSPAHPSPGQTRSLTGEIHITFQSDPTYPLFSSSSSWKRNTYVLTSLPLRKPRTFINDASEFLTSSLSGLASPFSSLFAGSANTAHPTSSPDRGSSLKAPAPETTARPLTPTVRATPEDMTSIGIELTDDEVLEEDKGDEAEVDDSDELKREVKMLTVSNEDKNGQGWNMTEGARMRRTFEVVSLRVGDRRMKN
ncbi:hypothetical protein F5880DRAFT_1502385 [Lentinula raphanica]|nr:hypothetical protein F5880DRAFT_1502385 [Lentinula raphanica]